MVIKLELRLKLRDVQLDRKGLIPVALELQSSTQAPAVARNCDVLAALSSTKVFQVQHSDVGVLLAADGGLLSLESRIVPTGSIRGQSEGLASACLLLGPVGCHRVVARSLPL